jgi:hypothetical protein
MIKMKLVLFSAALLLVFAFCSAMPSSRSDEEAPAPPARKPIVFRSHSRHPLQPLRDLHEGRKWRFSRNLEGRFEGTEPSSRLFRRQADTDEMMDKLLHIKRYHAPL